MRTPALTGKPVATAAIISLAVSGVFGFGVPALATSEARPTIIFDGNTLATSLPASETADRVDLTSAVSTASLSRTATTSRSGYTFGGWSLTAGGAATTTITTTNTTDTTRTIYAVWNTTLNYSTNGADSGTPSGNLTSETYRFFQTLTLPTAGTMVKSGYAFDGWMPATLSTVRSTTYTAASTATGNQTVYAAWIKTVTFNANTATTGTIPTSQVYVAGATALKLPAISDMTLRKPGYEFLGWSTTATGNVVSNPGSYIPVVAQQTLYATWRILTTKASSSVFFNPGKSVLRAGQKLVLRDLVDTLRGRTTINISVTARRHNSTTKALGKARNTAVILYLRSLGVEATFTRENIVGPAGSSIVKKNNRVTLQASWTNPTS
jgi:uncharacterized repeat protein (TIGR02543 family)